MHKVIATASGNHKSNSHHSPNIHEEQVKAMESSTAVFRRSQSLRYAKGFPQATNANGNSSRGVSRMTIRSKSTRTRMESQSLSARLSITQRNALVNTWRILKQQQQIGPLIKRIFQDLESISPKVKEVFVKATYVDCFARIESKDPPAAANSNATLEDHIRLMTRFFDEIVASVESSGMSYNEIDEGEDPMSMLIKKVGQQHGKLLTTCGFQAEIWEHLGEITMERICACDPIQKAREAGRAWRTLIAYVTDKLRCGFEGEAKTCSRKPSRVYFSGSNRTGSCQDNGDLSNVEDAKMLTLQLQNLRASSACDHQACDNCLE